MEAWQMRAGTPLHRLNSLPQNLPMTGPEMRLLLSFFINCSRAPSSPLRRSSAFCDNRFKTKDNIFRKYNF